MKWFNKKFLRL